MVLSDQSRQQVLDALVVMQRHSWDQGLLAAVLLESGRPEQLRVLLADAVARQLPDGRLAELDAAAAVNSAALGEILQDEASRTGDTGWAEAAARQRDWLLRQAPRATDGTLFHLTGHREVWADTAYLVVPALLAFGHRRAALAQLGGHRFRLRNRANGLWRARWDEDTEQVLDDRAWGTANGWAAAALVRTIPRLESGTRPLIEELGRLIEDCLLWRRPDGLFDNLLDDSDSFRETTAAAMLGYAALTAAAAGWLPDRFGELGQSLLEAVAAEIDECGRVAGACAAPSFDRPGFSPEAQAFTLLADTAHRRWRQRR